MQMSRRRSLKELSRAKPAWLAAPLVLVALIYAIALFHLFLTHTLQMKAWLATVVVLLACGQLLTAAQIYRVFRFPPSGRFYQSVHRWSGRLAIVLTLPVAYHCIVLLGFQTHSARVLIHSLLGSTLYGVVVAKVMIVRSSRFASWVLPVAGGLLFSILLGLWLTSALWFFTGALEYQ